MADFAGSQYDSAAHFVSETHNFEVQRTNHFEVVIDLKKLNLEMDSSVAMEHIRLSTKEIGSPKVQAEVIELKHGNDTVKVAAAPQFDELTLQVYDTIGIDQLQVMQAWFNKVFDRKTKLMGMVSDYKTTGTLYMYSPDCKIIRKWILEGIWIKTYGGSSNFSYDSKDAQTIEVTLSVDRYWEDSGNT